MDTDPVLRAEGGDLEPFADGGRTHGKRQEADIEPGSQCRREGQQCAEQLTAALLLRDRGQ